MVELEIGIGKSARQAFGLDQLSIVPSRRTRDAADVDISWQLDAFRLDLPLVAAPSDAVVSPAQAIELNRLGALAVLDLEGLWTRYEDPTPLLAELGRMSAGAVAQRLAELYAEPVHLELVTARVAEISTSGAVACGAVSPQHAAALAPAALAGELDVLVVQGTVVSADHVSKTAETLDLAALIRELDVPVLVGGCASYQAALHLMRTGAVGVIVGTGPGGSSTTAEVLGIGVPLGTAIADAAGARSRHLEETGVYVHVVAEGPITTGADVAKALACGADAVMLGTPLAGTSTAPGCGRHWTGAATHQRLPRAVCSQVGTEATLGEVLFGPARSADGRTNLVGALCKTIALCGYANVREFHKADVVVAPSAGRAPLAG